MRVANDPKLIFEKERFVNGHGTSSVQCSHKQACFSLSHIFNFEEFIDLILKETKFLMTIWLIILKIH